MTPPSRFQPPITTPNTPRRLRALPLAADPNDSWETWWNLHRLHYLPDRREAFGRNVLTPGEGTDDSWWAKHRAETAAAEILPFLREQLDPKTKRRDDVRASALLALARATTEPADVEPLLRWAFDQRAPQLVRESAALALGLLRRSEASHRLDGARLDPIRTRLFALFDEKDAPDRVRAFAALSLGLLADQPYADDWAKDGRLVVRGLWQRIQKLYPTRDLPVALFVALGLQPRAGVPDDVRDRLRRMAIGQRRGGRRWDAIERGHATATFLRFGGRETVPFLERLLIHKRAPKDVRRAAYLGFGPLAETLDADGRSRIGASLEKGLRLARDPLSEGLAHLAVGQLLGADLAHGEDAALARTGLLRVLLQGGRSGAKPSRGFSLLALGLAARNASAEARNTLAFRDDAFALILRTLQKEKDHELRAAASVAAGLAGIEAAKPFLVEIVGNRRLPPKLRGHAAVALGQLGIQDGGVVKAIHLALAERRDPELRRQAALGLALLGGRTALQPLLRELKQAKTERVTAQVVIALGRLGDLRAIDALKARARDPKLSEPARALAIVALGLIGDPEPRPSLLRVTFGSFYVARSPALHEAFTIL